MKLRSQPCKIEKPGSRAVEFGVDEIIKEPEGASKYFDGTNWSVGDHPSILLTTYIYVFVYLRVQWSSCQAVSSLQGSRPRGREMARRWYTW